MDLAIGKTLATQKYEEIIKQKEKFKEKIASLTENTDQKHLMK